MFNLHKLGLVLVVGGFAAICASIFTSAADTVTSNAFLSTITDTSTKSESETTDQLRRWSRRYYSQPSTSTTSIAPLPLLPTATPTTAPQQQIVPTSVPPTAVPQATKTPVPSTSTALNIIGVVQLGEGSGYQDSGDVDLSNGQAVTVVCQAQNLRIDELRDNKWEPFCTGSNDDDHVSIQCPSSLFEVFINSLSRTIVCGDVTVSIVPSGSSSSSSLPSPTSVPATPVPTATPPPASNGALVATPCFDIINQSNKVYENLSIGPCSGRDGIMIRNSSNITIRNVRITGAMTGIEVDDSNNITIDGLVNMNPTGGIPNGQHVQFDGSRDSVVRNSFGTGAGEDGFSAYQSSNILFENNEANNGTSGSGCAFIADDGAQSITFRNNRADGNVNCGIGIAAGSNHVVEDNYLSNCKPTPSDNACLYVWNQNGGSCSNIIVRRNTVNDSNPYWDGGNCSNIQLSGNSWQ